MTHTADPTTTSQTNSSNTHLDAHQLAVEKEQRKVEEEIRIDDIGLGTMLRDSYAIVARKGEDGSLYIRSAPGDPSSPRDWPKWKRYGIVLLASFLNNLVTIGVSSYSTGTTEIASEFNVSAEVAILGLTLFILGFALGPLFLAPLSEFFGRRPVYLISWFLFTVFQIPLAVPPNIATILVFRFLQGFTGAAPLCNTGGVVHDLFSRDGGGIAVGIYGLSSTSGPPLGNAFGGYIVQTLGFRYLYWIQLAIFGGFWFIIYFCLPETRDTIIMMKKAKALREITGNPKIYALHEQDREEPGRLWKVSLARPIVFLVKEPITYLSAAINGLTFGIIFLANQAFPLIFGAGNGGHNWTHVGAINLTYLSFVVGALIGFGLQPIQERFYANATARNGGKSVPEARFYSSLFGIWLLPIGLFLAAWTSFPSINFMAPIVGFTLFGIGFYMIITAILNYIVDGYGHYSASALGAVVFIRNLVACVFPLFSDQMFAKVRAFLFWPLFASSADQTAHPARKPMGNNFGRFFGLSPSPHPLLSILQRPNDSFQQPLLQRTL
ncbi:hypothetical protein P7C70_g3805, partial [Phenoliferia sp. Uapishka_3]